MIPMWKNLKMCSLLTEPPVSCWDWSALEASQESQTNHDFVKEDHSEEIADAIIMEVHNADYEEQDTVFACHNAVCFERFDVADDLYKFGFCWPLH